MVRAYKRKRTYSRRATPRRYRKRVARIPRWELNLIRGTTVNFKLKHQARATNYGANVFLWAVNLLWLDYAQCQWNIATTNFATNATPSVPNAVNDSYNPTFYPQRWNFIKSIFDLYKVRGVKIVVMPLRSTSESGVAESEPWMEYFDWDNNAATTCPSNLNSFGLNQRTKMHNPYRPFKVYIKCPTITQAIPAVNVNTTGIVPGVPNLQVGLIDGEGFMNPTAPPTNGVWYLAMRSNAEVMGTAIATIQVTYYITCKART